MWQGSITESQLCSRFNLGLLPGDKLLLLILSRHKLSIFASQRKGWSLVSCTKVVYHLWGFLINDCPRRSLEDVFAGQVWSQLTEFLLPCYLPGLLYFTEQSTGNIFMLLLFISSTVQRVCQGRKRGARNIGTVEDFSYCQAETFQAWM